jgi:serine/threonine protein kinase
MTSPSHNRGISLGSTDSSDHDACIRNNLLRVQTKADVFKKYEVLQEFGLGSMGTVCKVRIKEDKIGGSAYHAKPKGIVNRLRNSLSMKKEDSQQHRQRPASISQTHVYALKSIILDRVSPTFVEELKNEINILRSLDHPNIVKAHEVFFCKKKQIYIVLELCEGGDLYTRSPYTEKEAARIVTKLLSAVR